jgi:hypothetical protein
MELNLNTNPGLVSRVNKPQPETRSTVGKGPDSLANETSFGRTEALEEALNEQPDIRAGLVERARTLIADTNYPPQVAIRKIATLLAMNLQESE